MNDPAFRNDQQEMPSRQAAPEQSRDQKISRLKERIFLLQIEERRLCVVLTSQRKRDEELKEQARKDLKEMRDALASFTKQLVSLESELWKPD